MMAVERLNGQLGESDIAMMMTQNIDSYNNDLKSRK